MEGRSSKEADAITLGMLVTLQDVLLQLGRDTAPEQLQPLHVVGMVRSQGWGCPGRHRHRHSRTCLGCSTACMRCALCGCPGTPCMQP